VPPAASGLGSRDRQFFVARKRIAARLGVDGASAACALALKQRERGLECLARRFECDAGGGFG
jgi:hypothetical protein